MINNSNTVTVDIPSIIQINQVRQYYRKFPYLIATYFYFILFSTFLFYVVEIILAQISLQVTTFALSFNFIFHPSIPRN